MMTLRILLGLLVLCVITQQGLLKAEPAKEVEIDREIRGKPCCQCPPDDNPKKMSEARVKASSSASAVERTASSVSAQSRYIWRCYWCYSGYWPYHRRCYFCYKTTYRYPTYPWLHWTCSWWCWWNSV
ncbi:unnamed protein product, partial [Owenia fusiformis]